MTLRAHLKSFREFGVEPRELRDRVRALVANAREDAVQSKLRAFLKALDVEERGGTTEE